MSGGFRPRVIIVGAVAALVGGLLAVGVAAHTTSHNSSLNINAFTSGSDNNYVYGAVSSPSARCVGDRKVRVFRRAPGANPKLGSSHSSEAPGGSYTVTDPTGDLPQGSYYSQAKKRDLKPGRRHAHICKGAKSSDLTVGP